jgi:signal transduction histidine kinase
VVPYGARWMYSSPGTSDASRILGLSPRAGRNYQIYRWIDNVYRNSAYAVSTKRALRISMRIAVRDTGMGLTEGALARIFDLFEQVNEGPIRGTGGLGVGVAVTIRFVELHGGTITAESEEPNRGST